MIWLGVGGAAACGAIARLSITAAVERRFDGSVPWGTAAVNVMAAFALGLVAGADPTPDLARLLTTGFLGSFSTFSTWMVEGVLLARPGAGAARPAGWVGGLLAAGLLAYGLGLNLTR
ncbi:MAG: fluoride efflux transporter CrcB [Acidimicrobiia bacterium]|nr:fluoride efflux transporter CrcB [Acidimicrobiia bacterium]